MDHGEAPYRPESPWDEVIRDIINDFRDKRLTTKERDSKMFVWETYLSLLGLTEIIELEQRLDYLPYYFLPNDKRIWTEWILRHVKKIEAQKKKQLERHRLKEIIDWFNKFFLFYKRERK